IERIREVINNFINKLIRPSSVEATTRLNTLVDNINDLLVSEELFDDLLLRRDTNESLVYYSLNKSTNKPDISAEDLLKITENSVNSLNNAMNQLQYGGEAF